MTIWQRIIIIALCVLGTMLTRFLPFILFQKNTPKTVQYLGKALPPASFALLLVYCLRNVQLFSGNHGLPKFLALGPTILCSIAGSGICCFPSSPTPSCICCFNREFWLCRFKAYKFRQATQL